MGTGLKINIYECPYGHQTITKDCEEGIAPFYIACTNGECEEIAKSKLYAVDQKLIPTHEWYRPSNYIGLHNDEIEHVKSGGLLLKKIVG